MYHWSIAFNIFFILALFSDANANNRQSTIGGRDFIFGFINNEIGSAQIWVVVSNANDQPTNVTITSVWDAFQTINVIIPANTVQKISIVPANIAALNGDETASPTLVVEDKGLRLQSTLPVTVYAHSEISFGDSVDSFTLLPYNQLGMQYMAVGTVSLLYLFPNVIMAVAYEDNTTITIRDQTITLNALQVVTLSVRNPISGISIIGNKPFAAYSGNMCGSVQDFETYDYAVTTLIPVSAWGTQFPLVPFINVGATQEYQIVASENNTVVNTTDGQKYTMNAGEHRLIKISNVTGAMLASNLPIQLTQMGQHAVLFTAYHLGEAFLLTLPSVDKWSNANVLFQPTGFIVNQQHPMMFYVRIYTTLPNVGQIAMDNVTISALLYQRIAQSNYYWYESQTTNDTHRISALNTNVSYSVISYTYGFDKGCGFPIAYNLPTTLFQI